MTECTCHVHSPANNGQRQAVKYTEHTCRACGGDKPCRRCELLRTSSTLAYGFSMGGM